MKRVIWISTASAFAVVAFWLVAQVQVQKPNAASAVPDGALLYLEAKDFGALLRDWDRSQAKRTWLSGDDYAEFSRSRLFQRLSQAQDEFSAAATLPADANLLASVAGTQSALALYDIGNLQFVYLTRMEEAKVRTTPIWLAREKFEQRTEGASHFFVREDQSTNRTAAFAIDKGWLILGTRADLVAGVLDRLDGSETHGMPDEAWYADAVKQAGAPAGDLRMVLNLKEIVPSPYFRSYWVQRNITEMKQYRTALCDLHRTGTEYRETRLLLRAPSAAPRSSGSVAPLMSLAPRDAVFSSAQASPSADQVLAAMRETGLDARPEHAQEQPSAPAQPVVENAGSAADLEQRIDVAPVVALHTDPYAGLRTVLQSANLTGVLQVYRTASSPKQMFVGIDRGMVIEAATPWNDSALRDAISSTLSRDVTASELGVGWTTHGAPGGTISSLNGSIRLSFAVRGSRLYLATTETLLSELLVQHASSGAPDQDFTYEADFHHSADEQQVFRKLFGRLDSAGRTTPSNSAEDDNPQRGAQPTFFSGNISSLSRMGADMAREVVTEKDQGAVVTQTVIYQWEQK